MKIYLGDCLKEMAALRPASVDMVLCDLPYGTSRNPWDSIIPLEPLWEHWKRVCKKDAAIVLTGTMPFTAALVMSQPKAFKHSLVAEKSHAVGHLNANRAPLRKHEDVLVFCRGRLTYVPQKGKKSDGSIRPDTRGSQTPSYGKFDPKAKRTAALDVAFPTSIIKVRTSPTGGDKGLHPTQKPVALMEYLIRSYSNEGDVVLDCAMGAGTTGVACQRTSRRFIGIESDAGFYEVAAKRLGVEP